MSTPEKSRQTLLTALYSSCAMTTVLGLICLLDPSAVQDFTDIDAETSKIMGYAFLGLSVFDLIVAKILLPLMDKKK